MPSTLGNMIAAMVITAALAGAVLGISYKITKEPIEAAKDARKLEASKEVVSGEFDNNPFQDRIEIGKTGIELYPGTARLKNYLNCRENLQQQRFQRPD